MVAALSLPKTLRVDPKFMTTKIRSSLLLLCGLASAGILPAQTPKVEFPAASPTSTVKQRVGFTDIEIVYSRPGVKDRKIFGGLVPYGEVWRTGANSATKITFSTAVKFGGAEVPAGSYAIYTIPGTVEWTVILSKVTGQWGAYRYNSGDDLVRVKVTPVKLTEPIETFVIGLNDLRDESATLNLVWDRTRVPVKLEFEITNQLVRQIDAAMATEGKGKPYFQAAIFYLEHNLDLNKAAGWMDAAIAENPDAFYMFYHKARLLAKMGDKDGAVATAKKSIEMAAKAGGPAAGEYTRLNNTLIDSLK